MNPYKLAFWCWVAILGTLLARWSLFYVILEFFSYLFPDAYQNTALKTTIALLCAHGFRHIVDGFGGR